ncbi:hypothetical protein FRC04_002215 [Tulasnella sp. 424]|nr:hypothetical protein FRC04_002215 [Tulasnella sp. 424]KAG8967761.1 hypothetical protein FRC05_001940 [Tulasnella sp. 425]
MPRTSTGFIPSPCIRAFTTQRVDVNLKPPTSIGRTATGEEGAGFVASCSGPSFSSEDAEAYAIVAKVKAVAEALQIDAQARAEATRLARRRQRHPPQGRRGPRRPGRLLSGDGVEVERIAAYRYKTVFVPVGGAAGSGAADAVALGFVAGHRKRYEKGLGVEQQPPKPQQFGGQPKPPAK